MDVEVKSVVVEQIDTKNFKFFNPKIHIMNATTKNPDFFMTPSQNSLIEQNSKIVYCTLAEFKTFVSQLNDKFGVTNTHIITGGGQNKYIKIDCSFACCPYSQWFNFENENNSD